MFRSQDMKYVNITANVESSNEVIQTLGDFGKFHLTDLQKNPVNPPEAYTKQKRRAAQCDSLLAKLGLFRDLLTQYEVALPELPSTEYKCRGDSLLEIQDALTITERDITTSVLACNEARLKLAVLHEEKAVIDSCAGIIGADMKQSDEGQDHLLSIEMDLPAGADNVGVLAGTLPLSSKVLFHRLLFRASRGGNFVAQFSDMQEPQFDATVGEAIAKTVFYVKTPFSEVASRLARVCKVVGCTLYDLPDSANYSSQLGIIENNIVDTERVKEALQKSVVVELLKLAGQDELSPLKQYEQALRREKKCCEGFMCCNFSQDFVVIEGWCPTEELSEMKRLFGPTSQVSIRTASPPVGAVPPTYFKVNAFTAPFQSIVNVYGVPRYGEVNPGMFTCVTFPFIFGVMYGDIGHGTVLMCAGLYLILTENSWIEEFRRGKHGEGFKALFGARYTIALMGFFGAYCGFLYNDCMSNPISIFKTTWHFQNDTNPGNLRNVSGLWPDTNYVIPFGIDQTWYHRANSLLFMNSMKMKMAVTLGVLHMGFGVFLSMFNHIYFGEKFRLYFEAIPRMILLITTFGYMCAMIIIKFSVDWQMFGNQPALQPPPPSLIQSMIFMFLSPANFPDANVMYEGQAEFQLVLVIIALLCVPIMWVVPVYLKHHCGNAHHAAHADYMEHSEVGTSLQQGSDDEPGAKHEDSHASLDPAAASSDHGGHSFGDEMIHQSIHTIEYVLGCVSNTASYLRLWALSLAHAQLAEVFWDMMLMDYGLAMGPVIGIVGVISWTGATVSVLLLMDVLECFLHALRLHWVEFQNKFYNGDGVAFVPFQFAEPAF